MKAAIFLILGILVFPQLYKLRGTHKVYVDFVASIGCVSCTIYGLYLLFM